MRTPRHFFSVALALPVIFVSLPAGAADFYVDPGAGSAQNDGSQAAPWATVGEVVSAGHFGSEIHAGDTVWLRSGYHGELVMNGGSFAPPITIQAASGQKPTMRRVRFQSTSGFVLRGVSVSPSYGGAAGAITMIDVAGSASNITVEDSEAFSVPDASAWTADDWVNAASDGAQIDGQNNVLRNTVFKNVRFGIGASGPGAVIEHNQVVNFSADGLRGLGDNEIFQYNIVKNAYVGDPPDANHDDGFQSWSVGTGGVGTGEVRGVVLRGNTIINYEDENQPFRTTLQGVGCFDGTFVDWVVENNVVITDHWHGITFLGARGVHVVNNTVIDRNDVSPGPPWISVNNHKDGTAPTGCVVRNNLVTDFDNASTGVTEDHNIVLTDLSQFFVNPTAFDLHLLPNAAAVNAGSSDLAPAADREGVPRPQGSAVDIGAYEWHDASVVVDAGPPPGTGGAAGASGTGGAAGRGGAQGASGGASSNGGSTGNAGGGAGTAGGGATTGGGAAGSPTSGADGGPASAQSSGDTASCGCRLASDGDRPSLLAVASLVVGLAGRRLGRRRRAEVASR